MAAKYPTSRRPKHEADFREIVGMIEKARAQAYRDVNTTLLDLYWNVGALISRKVAEQGWGKGSVAALADYIQSHEPQARGFSASNLWRMKQMFETYEREPALSVLLREVSWTQNLLIMSRCRRKEERKFYLQMTRRENWSSRELERQIDGCLFERKSIAPVKLAAALRVLYPSSSQVFKDSYLLDFLDLPEPFDEHDLQKGLVANLKQFLLELGRDFCFVGEQYRVQVGNKDFLLDLLFYHRELRCLVAFELKVDDFKPEYLGKLSFYLEALDRDLRKSHENPSVGVLLCKSKDSEVVEYALSRTLSPALVAEYETKLPDRALLQAKLHELLQIAEAADEYGGRRKARR